MGKYTKEEIKVFENKELRIVRQAILKKLIEKCKLEDVYEVKPVTELSERYVDYVYEERKDKQERKETTKRGQVEMALNWVHFAEGLNFAKPNTVNIKILNEVLNEYKQVDKANANPSYILAHIFSHFGKYPEKTESVSKVIKSLMKG